MKRSIYSLFLTAFVFPLYAQQTGPLFRPTKISYYYTPMGGWDLEMVRKFKYDQNGNAVLAITEDSSGQISRKDSMIYSASSQVLEIHRYGWNPVEKKLVPEDRVINTYDAQGRMTKTTVSIWLDAWEIINGSEHLYAYDPSAKTETNITKLYDTDTKEWYNYTKTVTHFDELGEKDSIVHYSSDQQHNFVLFSRQTFTGWHNYEKEIEKGQTTERYVNNTWVLESTSSTERISGMWVRTELKATGPAAGTYKILFEEDNSFREVLKQSSPGWLSLSTFTRTGYIEKIVYNSFEGDILKSTETTEKEMDDQDNLIRTTQKVQGQNQQTTSFSEVLTDIQYDARDLPLEEISKATNSEDRSNYALYEKIVYSDYVDVRAVMDLENVSLSEGNAIRIYPNPGIGIFTVSETLSDAEASVFAVDGQMVRKTHLQGNKLDISDLPTGVYQLLLNNKSGSFRHKVVVVAR